MIDYFVKITILNHHTLVKDKRTTNISQSAIMKLSFTIVWFYNSTPVINYK